MKPHLFFACFAILAASLSPLLAADYFPELENGKSVSTQQFPLGPVGGIISVTFGTDEATIVSLAPGGPGAKAGLKPSDILTGVGGKKFKEYSDKAETGGDGLPLQLGHAILEAQDRDAPLELELVRDGASIDIPVDLPPMPSFAKEFPANCERSAALLDAACEWLADTRKENGHFGKKGLYTNALAGLALLASGNPDYRREIRDTADTFSDLIESEGAPDSNWHTPAIGIFLAEYLLATGDNSVREALQICCDAIGPRLEPETGRLGHSGTKLPYGGKALVITSVHAHLMWALAAQADIKFDNDAWDLSYRSVEAAIGKNGNVGYNFSARGDTQSMARTGAMASALFLADQSSSNLKGMNRWMEENYKRSTNCHAVTSMGLIFGFMGLKNSGPRGFRETMDYHQWMLALAHPIDEDHGAYYFGKRGNFGGDGYLGYRPVANYQTALILASAKNNTLWSFGNREKNWSK
jgi:hypothetical protein